MLPYLPLFYASRGFGLGEIGAALGLASVVGLVFSPLWGALSDRYRGSPAVIAIATVTALTGAALLAAQPDERLLVFAAAAVLGAGMAGLAPIIDARALETAGANRAGYGPLRAWGSFSYILGALGTGVLVESFGPRALFVMLVSALVATGLVGVTLRPVLGDRDPRRVTSTLGPLRDAGRLFGPRGLGLFLLGAFLTWLGMSSVLSFISLRFDELGAGATIVGINGALAAAIEVPVMLRFPALAARFGSERLVIAGAALIALRSLVATVASDPAIIVLAGVFAGLGFALFIVGGVTFVSRHVPRELAATAQGIFQGIGTSLSQVIAAASGGALAATVGIAGLFAVGTLLGGLATLIIALAVRPSRRAPHDRGYAPSTNPTEAT